MTKSLHQHTKKELVAIIQDYQEAISEIESVVNALLIFKDHHIHVVTGLHDIRSALDRHIFKREPEHRCA